MPNTSLGNRIRSRRGHLIAVVVFGFFLLKGIAWLAATYVFTRWAIS
jgi:hypothetical protein